MEKTIINDYFGNPINKGDVLLRVSNAYLQPCICTRVTNKVYFTHWKYTEYDYTNKKYNRVVKELSSRQLLINCSALGRIADVPKEHIEFYNNLKNKK